MVDLAVRWGLQQQTIKVITREIYTTNQDKVLEVGMEKSIWGDCHAVPKPLVLQPVGLIVN